MSKALDDVTNSTPLCSSHIGELYEKMASLLKQYEKGRISAQLVKDTLDFAEYFIQIGRLFPHQLLAQLHFYKPNHCRAVNHIFNTTLCTYLLGYREKWHDTSLQQLVCCALTQFACSSGFEKTSKQDEAKNRRQLGMLKQYNHHLNHSLINTPLEIWRVGLLSAHKRWIPSQAVRQIARSPHCSSARILNTAALMAHMLTPTAETTTASNSYPKVLATITQHLPSATYPMIEALCTYPGLYPPGCPVLLKTGECILVLSTYPTEILGKTFDQLAGNCAAAIQRIAHTRIRAVLPPQSNDHLNTLDQWWDSGWQSQDSELIESGGISPHSTIFRLDKPPPSLLAIQKHLDSDDYDLNHLTAMIADEPVFADHLRYTASQHSREQLLCKHVKHAVLFQGANRAKALLLERALRVRLEQHYFPLQPYLQEYVTCCRQIAALLAERSEICQAEDASCWISFTTAGLFTHPDIKQKLTPPASINTGTKISELIFADIHIKDQKLPKHALKLIDCWAQPETLKIAIQSLERGTLPRTRQSKEITALIGTSLILGKLLFAGQTIPTSHNNSDPQVELLQKILPLLNLSMSELPQLCQQAMENHPPVWPLR